MTAFPIDRPALMAALATSAARFGSLLRSLDAADAACPVPWLTWTVGDTAAHVLTVVRRAISDRRRSTSPADLAELNARCLHEVPDRAPATIADLLAVDTHTMLSHIFPRVPDAQPVPFHAGVTTTFLNAAAVILGEIVVHGYDIAGACQRPWPIERELATLIWCGGVAVLPAWLNAEAAHGQRETYRIELAATDQAARIELADAQITIGPDDGRPVDATTSLDPTELLLAFPYRRRVPGDPIVARLVELFHPL